MSLYKRIFMLISLIVVLIIVTTTLIMTTYQQKSMSVEADFNMSSNMSIVMSQLEQNVEDYTALGISFANNKEFKAYFESNDLSDEQVVNEALIIVKQIKSSSELLNNVTLTPRGGIINLDALGKFYDEGPDESQLEYYLELSSNPEMSYFINKPLIGTANNQPIFGIGIQMDNDGSFLGILGLPINLNRLMEQSVIPDIRDNEIEVLMVNSAGTIVWAPDQSIIHNEATNFKAIEPALFNKIMKNTSGDLETSIFDVDARIKYEYYETFDTYVIVYKDITLYNNQIRNSLLTNILLGVIMLIISSVIIYFSLLRITNPIVKLVEYSNAIASEDLDITISEDITQRRDEIGKLGRTYQTMITSLNTSFSKIQHYGEMNHFLATHDELTDLPNRRFFNIKVKSLMDSYPYGSIIMMDIDNFKSINDTMGHLVGDKVLVGISHVLKELSNDSVLVSRFGGDEFIVFVGDNGDNKQTEAFASSLKTHFEEKQYIQGKPVDVKFSIGITKYPKNSEDIDELIRQSDIALYMAKNQGKNRVNYFETNMQELVFMKADISKELNEALANDGFRLVYQPQVDLRTGKVTCYEALLRLKNNRYQPGTFIEVAEEKRQIIEIGRWVVREAVEQIVKWRNMGLDSFTVSVNFSAVQINDTGFCQYIESVLAHNNIEGKYLELEVTENIFIHQEEKVIQFFDKITSLGIELSIDDFGTGYSSLTYMVSFPVNKIKLDRQLILKYLYKNEQQALQKLIELIHSLGYKIVAEGVEQANHMTVLKEVNCDAIQGFYFSKPIKAEKVSEDNQIYDV